MNYSEMQLDSQGSPPFQVVHSNFVLFLSVKLIIYVIIATEVSIVHQQKRRKSIQGAEELHIAKSEIRGFSLCP